MVVIKVFCKIALSPSPPHFTGCLIAQAANDQFSLPGMGVVRVSPCSL